ncbi:MAG: hypothetical protein IJV82_01600 [Oscillospiraceae bacterium]|nr:hypothetical protein [Oscillospiraceae bacterium]
MKKLTTTILLLLSIIVSAFPTMAEEQLTDSLEIDTQTRQLLGVAEDVEVMKLYLDSPMICIRDGRPIEDMVKSTGPVPVYTSYVYPIGDLASIDPYTQHHDQGPTPGFAAKTIKDGVVVVEDAQFYYSFTCRYFYELNDKHEQILKTLGNHVVAEKIYYFDDWWMRDFFVYYVTNVGDYVLYTSCHEWTEDTESYLLSVEAFRPFAREIMAECGERDGPTVYIPEDLKEHKLDLSKANVNVEAVEVEDDTNCTILYWAIPVAAVAAAGGVWFFLHRRKKKNSTESTPTE